MGLGVILDTGVVIAAERGKIDLRAVVGDRDPAIAAVTAMELLLGAEQASDPRRDMIALNVEALLAVIPVVDYGVSVARAHALLGAQARRTGQPRGAIDLIIAATAAATQRTVVTTDSAARFDELPGVRAETVLV